MHAERIDWLRRAETPPPTRALPQAETKPFALPELPVSINLAKLQLDHVTFAEPVFGQAADLSATGALNLAGGALDTTLDVKRLDAPGGALALKASFSNATRQLGIDLALQEPQGGVVATLLKIEGAPAIDLRVNGSGPLDQVDVNFSLDAGRRPHRPRRRGAPRPRRRPRLRRRFLRRPLAADPGRSSATSSPARARSRSRASRNPPAACASTTSASPAPR